LGIVLKYCPQCREKLRSREIGGAERLVCSSPACQFVHWNNPTPVVAALVELDGNYILGRNSDWPADLFSMFTGFLEPGEAPERGIIREVEEELGLAAKRTHLIGHFPLARLNQLIIAFAVEVHGELKLNGEIVEVRMVTPAELAGFDFGPLTLTREVVGQWRRLTKG
jgi:NADH pyrophosphatase NudC (nudix superfamily)